MLQQFQWILDHFVPAPQEWFDNHKSNGKVNGTSYPAMTAAVVPLDCTSYADLVAAWSEALYWTDALDVTLSSILATVASTNLIGAQLWIRAIATAGSGKSTLCEGITSCSEYAYPFSIQTGFHSGQEGNSLWPYINGKTAVINEGDMIVTHPQKDQILAQIRDSWGGEVNAHYRNGVRYSYKNMRTTWILAGTETLRELNHAPAGDRFLDTISFERDDVLSGDEWSMIRFAVEREAECGGTESGGEQESKSDPKKALAIRKMAGFVKHLREKVSAKIQEIPITKQAKDDCAKLGVLVAYMRARPSTTKTNEESLTQAELATRVSQQLLRLARCTAAVMGTTINGEVMRRVAKVASDTCYGATYDIIKVLATHGPQDELAIWYRISSRNRKGMLNKSLNTLLELRCIVLDDSTAASGVPNRRIHIYKLSPPIAGLFARLKYLLKGNAEIVNA